MPGKIDRKKIDAIYTMLKMYPGRDVRQIAVALRVSTATVRRVLNGTHPFARGRRSPRQVVARKYLSDEQVTTALGMAARGEKVPAICKRVAIGRTTAYRILARQHRLT